MKKTWTTYQFFAFCPPPLSRCKSSSLRKIKARKRNEKNDKTLLLLLQGEKSGERKKPGVGKEGKKIKEPPVVKQRVLQSSKLEFC
ncbi:hypothetical protein CDAR_4071 [Caerostris darwini]|uniref:Uncharacterized protein n=1 Tax=Caerostris darwini TaxID=1538125 RepID=A0AAV4WYZ7_9ARAC|nr:hypothetical protein CDAR_4071 [Caerostris darwini]